MSKSRLVLIWLIISLIGSVVYFTELDAYEKTEKVPAKIERVDDEAIIFSYDSILYEAVGGEYNINILAIYESQGKPYMVPAIRFNAGSEDYKQRIDHLVNWLTIMCCSLCLSLICFAVINPSKNMSLNEEFEL